VRLVVEEGYNRGAEFPVPADGALRLGRDDGCEVQLLDEGVSRVHAEVLRDGPALSVRDLDSTNGVRVNGVPTAGAGLAPGDRVALGGVRLLVLPDPGDGEPSPSLAAAPTRELPTGEGGPAPALPEARPAPGPVEEVLGQSPPVRELLSLLGRVAPSEATVLVQGESGTGKELVARAVHRLSPRRRGPFVVLNCAALPAELVESELFGHEKGAFTGALARKTGLAEAAHGGTLFLDELGELPAAAQAKLLRFLESRELVRVGATRPIRVDVRLVAATHRDLDAQVAAGELREDLLYRLRVVELRVPPLRERGDDVLLLAESFLARFGPRLRFDDSARTALAAYGWPGNVRELKNAVEAASILTVGPEIGRADLPARVQGTEAAPRTAAPADEPLSLEEAERRAIAAALEHTGGHRTKAAALLRIDRKTLYVKLKAFGLG